MNLSPAGDPTSSMDFSNADLSTYSDFYKVVVGTYTGDGSLNQGVDTGLTTLRIVMLIPQNVAGRPLLQTTSHLTNYVHSDAGAATWNYQNTLTAAALLGGSFFVDDNAEDGDPNKTGQVYVYVAWGVA